MSWDGDDYQSRFDRLAAGGADVHGEASFVGRFEPRSVLDAGCGSGRVAIELARRGIEVVGVDLDPSMLATARRLAPELEWVDGDLRTFDLGRTFDLVVLAGNVPLFTPPGTQADVAERCAAHVRPGGHLVTGFSTDRGYTADDWSAAVPLDEVGRFATWDGEPWTDGDYAVLVHVRAGPRG
jgi:SAM-dependent methyltransferase